MHYIPGLRLRVDEETEMVGIDQADMGEVAYDYVGLDLELKPSVYAFSPSLEEGKTEMRESRGSS